MNTYRLPRRPIAALAPGVLAIAMCLSSGCAALSGQTFNVAPQAAELKQLEAENVEGGPQAWRAKPLPVAQAALCNVLQTQRGWPQDRLCVVDDESAWKVLPHWKNRKATWKGPDASAEVIVKKTRAGLWYADTVTVRDK